MSLNWLPKLCLNRCWDMILLEHLWSISATLGNFTFTCDDCQPATGSTGSILRKWTTPNLSDLAAGSLPGYNENTHFSHSNAAIQRHWGSPPEAVSAAAVSSFTLALSPPSAPITPSSRSQPPSGAVAWAEIAMAGVEARKELAQNRMFYQPPPLYQFHLS